MNVIFDLDGTLANCEHRVKHLQGPVKDWEAFYADCHLDEPIEPMVTVARTLSHVHMFQIWTGRTEAVRAKTTDWLWAQGLRIRPIHLRMRPVGDHRPDFELKTEWLDEGTFVPDIIFEDRASVVAMWRERGILCAQVAPGDF